MEVHELARKINKILGSKVYGNEEEWLAIDNELIQFNKVATAEEIETLRKECPAGEMFCIIVSGIRYERTRGD